MLENPPYRDETANNTKEKKGKIIINYVYEELKKEKTDQALHRDLSNQFIWSALKYYLKKENDYFILYSPVKYFKSLGLMNKIFVNGYLLNREYFHATASAISLIQWQNINKEQEEFELKAIDIDKTSIINDNNEDNKEYKSYFIKDINIRKVYKRFTNYKDIRCFKDDEKGVCCNSDGTLCEKDYGKKVPIYNKNIIGFLDIHSFGLDAKVRNLTRCINFQSLTQCYGFYLRSDNYITKLPLFCAKLYPQENWYERDIYFTTADKGEEYLKDNDLLKSCFIYTCLSRQNKCISFDGSDGRFYKNELCFDKGTIASNDLKQFSLNEDDKKLLETFNNILKEAYKIDKYNSKYTYGLYQIDIELNEDSFNEKGEKIGKKHPELNTDIETLKVLLKNYYKKYIQDKLFEYELLK